MRIYREPDQHVCQRTHGVSIKLTQMRGCFDDTFFSGKPREIGRNILPAVDRAPVQTVTRCFRNFPRRDFHSFRESLSSRVEQWDSWDKGRILRIVKELLLTEWFLVAIDSVLLFQNKNNWFMARNKTRKKGCRDERWLKFREKSGQLRYWFCNGV